MYESLEYENTIRFYFHHSKIIFATTKTKQQRRLETNDILTNQTQPIEVKLKTEPPEIQLNHRKFKL